MYDFIVEELLNQYTLPKEWEAEFEEGMSFRRRILTRNDETQRFINHERCREFASEPR